MIRHGHLNITHDIPPLEELKRRTYCKFHNSSSHATNDCNVFRRQVQWAINEGRLTFWEMKIDKAPFPVHTIYLNNSRVLIRPEQVEGANGKNMIIGEKRPITVDDKILAKEVVQEKTPDRKKTLKISIKARTPGGQECSSDDLSATQTRPVRVVAPTGQTGSGNRSDRTGSQPRTFKPRRPKVGTWKTNQPKAQGRLQIRSPPPVSC